MKGKGVIAILAIGGVVMAAAPALAAYTSLSHNLINGQNDTTFDPNTGKFVINSSLNNLITHQDPPVGTPLSGTTTNAQVYLETTFNSIVDIGGTFYAKFLGGSFSLTYDFDPTGVDPIASHEISGPVTAMFFTVTTISPTSGRIDGLGRWTAATVDLPGDGIWPDGGGYSSIDSLSVSFGDGLVGFDWTTPLGNRVETQYTLFPDDRAIPEPTSLALIALGAMALIRRRS
jgi:hypothetical protein